MPSGVNATHFGLYIAPLPFPVIVPITVSVATSITLMVLLPARLLQTYTLEPSGENAPP